MKQCRDGNFTYKLTVETGNPNSPIDEFLLCDKCVDDPIFQLNIISKERIDDGTKMRTRHQDTTPKKQRSKVMLN